MNPGAGAAHEDGDVGHEGVKTANGARVLTGAAGEPTDECGSFSLKLQVCAHEEGQDGAEVAGDDCVGDAGAVSHPLSRRVRQMDKRRGGAEGFHSR